MIALETAGLMRCAPATAEASAEKENRIRQEITPTTPIAVLYTRSGRF